MGRTGYAFADGKQKLARPFGDVLFMWFLVILRQEKLFTEHSG